MAIAAEQLKELITNNQKSPYTERGRSVSVVADLLGVEFEDLRNAMEKEIRVYNWQGFGDSPPYYYKPPPASDMEAKFSVWRKIHNASSRRRCTRPLIVGWFGTTLHTENLTRHIFNGKEYVLDTQGVLIHTVDTEQYKDWKTKFLNFKEWESQYFNPEEIAEYMKGHLMMVAKNQLSIHKGEHHKRSLEIEAKQTLRTFTLPSLRWQGIHISESIKAVTETEDIHATNQDQLLDVSHNLDLPISEDEDDDQEYELTDQELELSLAIDSYYEKSQNYNLSKCKITLLPRLEIGDELLVPIATCARLMEFKQAIEQDEHGEEARRNYVPSSVLTEAELFLRLETIWWLDKITGAVSVGAERVKVKDSNDYLGNVEALDLDVDDDCGDDLDIYNEDEGEDASSDEVELGNEHLGIEDLQLLSNDAAIGYFEDELDCELGGNMEEEVDHVTEYESNRQTEVIRNRYKDGETLEELAEDYGIPVQEIFKLVDNIKLPDGITQEDAENNESQRDETDGKERRCELYKTVNGRKYNSKQVGLCWYYE